MGKGVKYTESPAPPRARGRQFGGSLKTKKTLFSLECRVSYLNWCSVQLLLSKKELGKKI